MWSLPSKYIQNLTNSCQLHYSSISLVSAMCISSLDYCNSPLANLPTSTLDSQESLNTAIRGFIQSVIHIISPLCSKLCSDSHFTKVKPIGIYKVPFDFPQFQFLNPVSDPVLLLLSHEPSFQALNVAGIFCHKSFPQIVCSISNAFPLDTCMARTFVSIHVTMSLTLLWLVCLKLQPVPSLALSTSPPPPSLCFSLIAPVTF